MCYIPHVSSVPFGLNHMSNIRQSPIDQVKTQFPFKQSHIRSTGIYPKSTAATNVPVFSKANQEVPNDPDGNFKILFAYKLCRFHMMIFGSQLISPVAAKSLFLVIFSAEISP